MDNSNFLIDYCERQSLSIGTRIFYSILGIISIYISIHNGVMQWLPLFLIGILFLIYGVVGLKIFKSEYRISINKNVLTITRSFQQTIVLELDYVKCIILKMNEMQVHYADYVKSYNLSWLPKDEYLKLNDKLNDLNELLMINASSDFGKDQSATI